MDNARLLAKIKENAITLVVLIVAAIIASKVYQSKKIELQNIKNLKADEEQKNVILGEIGSLENKLDDLKKNFSANEPKKGMENIENLAKSASVSINKLNPMSETVSGLYTKYLYEMTLSAKNYHQVGKFISLLENSPDNFMVEDLFINNNAAGGLETFTVSLTVYTIAINK